MELRNEIELNGIDWDDWDHCEQIDGHDKNNIVHIAPDNNNEKIVNSLEITIIQDTRTS